MTAALLAVVRSAAAARVLAGSLVLVVLGASCAVDQPDTPTVAVTSIVEFSDTSGRAADATAAQPTSSTAPTPAIATRSATARPTAETPASAASTEAPDQSGGDARFVYFSAGDGTACDEVVGFDRSIDASVGPALAVFDELVHGPTEAEKARGARSPFSAATAHAVLSVDQTGGALTLDLADIRAELADAAGCGRTALISSLNATAFQFDAVDRIRYLFDGSCEDFGTFTNADGCEFEPGAGRSSRPFDHQPGSIS